MGNTKQIIPSIAGLVAVSVIGCASWFNKIEPATVLRSAEPYTGAVEVRLPSSAPKSSAIFEMKVHKNEFGGLPTGEFMEEIKREGARLGANIMVFQCGDAGTTGQTLCIVHGYREQL